MIPQSNHCKWKERAECVYEYAERNRDTYMTPREILNMQSLVR